MSLRLYLSLVIPWFLLTIFFHELGHYYVARRLGLNPRMGFDKKGFKVTFKKKGVADYKAVLIGGLVAGLIPSFCLIPFSPDLAFICLLLYVFGGVREIVLAKNIKESL